MNRTRRPALDIDVTAVKDVFASAYTCNPYVKESNPHLRLDLHDLPSDPLFFSVSEVQLVLRNLKKGSAGPDELPFWTLRDHSEILAPALHDLCSASVQSGIFPDCLKRAWITPIPKCNQPSINDYRPISLLPVISKVLEKLVYRKWFRTIIRKLDLQQFAFIPRIGQGTTTALTFLIHHILSFLDTPGCVRLLMVDFSKAFDRLPHDVILSSLSTLNAPKELVIWISSYLAQRSQCVKIGDKRSAWFDAPSGVPQGSVLAPLLFAIAINDLRPICNNSVMIKFADDVCLLHFLRSSNDDDLHNELEHIKSWSTAHGLHLNISKTKLMHFQTKRNITLPCLIDDDTRAEIEIVSTAKILGLVIDNQISWKAHLEHTMKRLRSRVYMLYSLKAADAPKEVIWLVYCAMIRAIASYAFPAWSSIPKSHFAHFVSFERQICKLFKLPENLIY